MTSALLMGVDLGTSGTKTVIIDQDGHLLSCATREYGINTPRPGWAEQNPQVWLQAAVETMGQALVEADVPPQRIEAIISQSGASGGRVALWGRLRSPFGLPAPAPQRGGTRCQPRKGSRPLTS